MDPTEISCVRKYFILPKYFFIRFKDIELIKSVVKNIADRPDVLIDNNHGLVIPGNEFIKRINSNPGWDWAFDE